MSNFSFPKALRVTKSNEYKRLSQKGKRLFGSCLVADYVQGEKKRGPRVGITVSKKYGKAHERNRFKRLVRESFRLHQHLLPPSLAINIRPSNRQKQEISLEAITHDLKKLFVVKALPPLIQEPLSLVVALT